jgi:hypothetical protein
MAEQESLNTENGKPGPSEPESIEPFESLGREDRLASVSWYLVATGIVALVLAAICLWMGRSGATAFFSHKDFALNPIALGRLLLLVGILFYAAGRVITYYRRFRKR